MGLCISKQHEPQSFHARDLKPLTATTRPPLLSDFELRRVVGKGAFGKVKMVLHRASGATYALKYIDKDVCIERNAAANVVRERKILEALSHPLVCNLRYAFQDVEYLYLVTDLMLGGDLRFHLLRKTFTEAAVRHWIAEVSVALSYCHDRGIIHRDVKPDNVLLTGSGHVKLADFNISTQIRGNTYPHSRSGSLFYMAPEVHTGKYYDFSIDFWSLGVMFYECIYGHRAFGGKSNADVAHSICNTTVTQCPTNPAVTDSCKAAIDTFLIKIPTSRTNSLSRVKQLRFFSSLDWPALELGCSVPVFVPGDFKNFDASWELEEILLHDSPLESKRPSARKRGIGGRSDEMHDLLEKYFTNFDYTKVSELPTVDVEQLPLIPNLQDSQEAQRCSIDASTTNAVILTTESVSKSFPSITDESKGNSGKHHKSRLFKKKSNKKPVELQAGVLATKACGRLKVQPAGERAIESSGIRL